MRKHIILLFALTAIISACDEQPLPQPILQPVQLEQSFWVRQGESVQLGSENLILADFTLEGWHPRGFAGPLSTARMTIAGEEISISHMLKCEFEFVGKETYCERDDAFYERLDTFSTTNSNHDNGAFREVAQLQNGLKIYMLFVEIDQEASSDDFVEISSAEFLIRKD